MRPTPQATSLSSSCGCSAESSPAPIRCPTLSRPCLEHFRQMASSRSGGASSEAAHFPPPTQRCWSPGPRRRVGLPPSRGGGSPTPDEFPDTATPSSIQKGGNNDANKNQGTTRTYGVRRSDRGSG